MCTTMKSTSSCPSYNTHNSDVTPWNQYGGTGVTLTDDMKSLMAAKGVDPSKLGQRTWVRLECKAGEATVFVSAYRPCKRITGMCTVWNQHVRYYQRERDIEEPNGHALFIADLCSALGDLRDLGYNVVLGMDSNNDVCGGAISAALADIKIKEVVINNHRRESVPTACSKNRQHKPIDRFWTSQGTMVLRCGFFPFPSIVCMVLTQTTD